MESNVFPRCWPTKWPAYWGRRVSLPPDDLSHAVQHRTFLFVPRRGAGAVLFKPARAAQIYSAGGQLFLLRKLELQIHPAAADLDGDRLYSRYLAGEDLTGAPEEGSSDIESLCERRFSRLLQVL